MLTRAGKVDRHYLQAAATARVLIMVFIAIGLRWREYGYCCCLLLVVCWCGGPRIGLRVRHEVQTYSRVLASSCWVSTLALSDVA